MMYFGEISDACITVLGVVYFLRELLKIVCILIPIALIVMLSLDFFKGVISFDDGSSKVLNYVLKRIIYTIVIFLLPSTIFGVFEVIGVNAQDSDACWTYVGETSVEEIKKLSKAKEEALEKETKKIQEEITEKLSKQEFINSDLKRIIDTKSENNNNEDTSNEETNGKVTLDWNDLTKTSNLTASKLKRTLDDLGKPIKNFSPYATTLINAEKKYKVNVFFLIALEAHESGNITSKLSKDCNNLGGVKYFGDDSTKECRNGYRKFSSKSAFIQYHAELLGNKYLKKSGKYYNGTAIADVKKNYCREASCSTWVKDTKKIGNKLYNKAKSV